MINIWTGTIGHIGKPTKDGRTIVQVRTSLEKGELPLDWREGDPAELRSIGKVLAVSIDQEGTITAAGTTTLEPGDYVPGLVLCDVESELARYDGSPIGEIDPEEFGDLDLREFCSGTLCSVFVHPQEAGDAPAAWLDAKITVVAS